MSKSLGNFFTVREVLPTLRHPEVMRYFLLVEPLSRADQLFDWSSSSRRTSALNRIYTALRDVPTACSRRASEHTTRFHEAMDDDFNTPEALAVLQTLTREINTARDAGKNQRTAALAAELRALAGVLGLAQLEPADWFRRSEQTAGRSASSTPTSSS